MRPLDPYSVLGIAPTAREDQVKAAYRARSRLLHPDVHRDADGRAPQAAYDAFDQLSAAYRAALENIRHPVPGAARTEAGEADRRVPGREPGGDTVRDAVTLAGVALLGWLLVTDLVPAVVHYSTR